MGIHDLIDNIRYANWKNELNEVREIFSDASKEFKQLKQEGRELFSDGFREMILKGKADYQTSFEKNSDAGKIIQQAVARCKKAEDELREKARVLSEQVFAHHQHIESIMRGPIASWHERSKTWGDIRVKEFVVQRNLDLKVLPIVPRRNSSKPRRSSRTFDVAKAAPSGRNEESYWPDVPGLPPLVFLNYGWLMAGLEQQARVKAANAFLEDAKDFRIEVKKHVREIRNAEILMLAVSLRIRESEKLISSFEGHLRKVMSRIRLSKATRALTPRASELAQLSSLIVSAIITLSKDALIDPNDGTLEKKSNLHSDLRQLSKLIETYT